MILAQILMILMVLGLAIVYGTLVSGLIFYKFYYWFLLPVFPEMPQITFLGAIGLAFFTTVIKTVYIDEAKDEYKDPSKKYVSLLYPWILLFFGWLVQLIIY